MGQFLGEMGWGSQGWSTRAQARALQPFLPPKPLPLSRAPQLLHPSFSSREPFPSVLNPSEPSPSHSHSAVPPPCPGLPQTSSPCPGGFGGALTGFRVPAPRISSAPRAARSAAAPCRVAADLPSLLGHLRGTNSSHLPGRRLSGRGRRSPGARRRPESSTACTVHSPKAHLTPTPENEEGSASLELPLPARSHTHSTRMEPSVLPQSYCTNFSCFLGCSGEHQGTMGTPVHPTGSQQEDLLRELRIPTILLPSDLSPPQMISEAHPTRQTILMLEREGNKISANCCKTLPE